MERRNIEGFENAYPGRQFPTFRVLQDDEMQGVRSRIKTQLGLGDDVDNLQLVQALGSLGEVCGGMDARSSSFSLQKSLEELDISPLEKMFVNFYRFDDIDELRLEDVSEHFEYIWYEGSDDIDLFDDTLSWILSVSHDGEISITRFPTNGERKMGRV